jgi:ribosomal protein S27E
MKEYNNYMNKAWVEYKSKHSKHPKDKVMMNEDAINDEVKRIGVKYNKKAVEKAYRRWFSRDEEGQGNQTMYRRYYCPQCDNESESSYDRRRKKMTCDKCGTDVDEIED